MFRTTPNHQIDRAKWKQLVESGESNNLYGRDWFLDAVAPNWSIITDEDYSVGLPFLEAKKMGQPYIFQPPFSQYFNIFSSRESSSSKQVDLLQSIPEHYRMIDIHLKMPATQIPQSFWVQCQKSQVLRIDLPYPKIAEGYKRGLRYAIRKARVHGLVIETELNLSEFEKFALGSELYRQQAHYRNNHRKLIDLARAAKQNQSGNCMGVRGHDGQLITVALILWDDKRIYTSFFCNNPTGRELCGSHLLIDTIIRLSEQRFEMLDFVGSNIESIAFFNKQFGAQTQNYFRIVRGSKSLSTCLRKTWNELALAR